MTAFPHWPDYADTVADEFNRAADEADDNEETGMSAEDRERAKADRKRDSQQEE